jgi:hypothetical protein
MKRYLESFIHFMETEPAYKTIWFIPLTFLLWLVLRSYRLINPKKELL